MSTLMVKDGTQQEFPDDQVDDALLAGWQPVDGRIPAFWSYQDPSTGEQVLREGRVPVERYGEVAQQAADSNSTILRRSPELQTVYQQQQEMARERAVAAQEGVLGQFAFSTADRLAFGGLSSLTRTIDPEAGARLTEQSAILARQNPGVDLAATLASIGIPLAFGGAGLARGFMGPTGLAMEAGQLARSGLGGVAGRLAGGAIEGGLDVALMEAVDANIRNDYEGLSERMLSSGVMGAVFGTALEGGLLYREARNARRLEQEVLGRVRADQLAAQPQGVLQRIWGRAQELFSGSNPNAVRVRRLGDTPVTNPEAVAAYRRVADNEADFLRPLVRDADDALVAHRQVREQLADARWFQSPAVRQAWDAAPNQQAALRQVQDGLAEASNRAQANKVKGEVGRLAREAQQAAKAGDVEGLLAVREEIKRFRGRGGAAGDVANDVAASIDNGLAQAGGSFGESLALRQNVLEGIDLFEAYLGNLVVMKNGAPRINGDAVRKLLDDFARGGNDQAVQALEDVIRGQLIQDARSLGIQIQSYTDDIARSASSRASNAITDWEAYQKFRGLELNINSGSGFAAQLTQGVGAGVLAAGIAGDDSTMAFGGGAALAAGFLSKPTGAARFMNTLRSIMGRQDARITASATNVRSAMRGNPISTSKIAPVTATGKALLSQDRQERERVYETVASRVEELLANPSSFYQTMLPQVVGADKINPQLGTQMGMDAQRAITVLAENVPLSRRARRNLPQLPGITIPPSDSEMDEFLEAAAVIEDPIFALDLYSAGRLTNTGARALERANPAFYRGMTSEVFQEYSRMVQEGQMPDFQASIQASTLMGIALDPSMDPSMLLALQSNYSQTAEQERAVRSPDTVQREVGNLYASNNSTMSQGLQ